MNENKKKKQNKTKIHRKAERSWNKCQTTTTTTTTTKTKKKLQLSYYTVQLQAWRVYQAKCEETTGSVHLHRHKRFPNYFVFSKIAFPRKVDLLGMFFILIPQNIVLFSQTKWNVGFKAVLFRQKTRKFLPFNKSKIQFSQMKKMCASKEQYFV